MHTSHTNPRLSSEAQLNGAFDFNKTPLLPFHPPTQHKGSYSWYPKPLLHLGRSWCRRILWWWLSGTLTVLQIVCHHLPSWMNCPHNRIFHTGGKCPRYPLPMPKCTLQSISAQPFGIFSLPPHSLPSVTPKLLLSNNFPIFLFALPSNSHCSLQSYLMVQDPLAPPLIPVVPRAWRNLLQHRQFYPWSHCQSLLHHQGWYPTIHHNWFQLVTGCLMCPCHLWGHHTSAHPPTSVPRSCWTRQRKPCTAPLSYPLHPEIPLCCKTKPSTSSCRYNLSRLPRNTCRHNPLLQ